MSDFWADLEESTKDQDLEAMAVPTSGDYPVPEPKDYYCRIKSWEFGNSSKKGTPGCMCRVELLAPCDGIDVDDCKGVTVLHNMWLSKAAIPWTLKSMTIMAGEPIDSVLAIKRAKLDANMFKMVNNKIGDYEGNKQFRTGFINAMTKEDHRNFKDITGKSSDFKESDEFNESDMEF